MEKMDYVRAQMDIDEFETNDVITTSTEPLAPVGYDHYEGGGY